MTVRIGSNVIAPGIASNEEFLEGLSEDKTATVKQLREEFSRVDRLPLFAPMRSPYLLNDVSWLRSDTFSWHNGDIYISAYNLLATLYTDNSATTASDTIEGITITYKRVSNGMKICDSDQENNLINLYNSVGVAWYFLIDTTDKKFKLPRNKFDFTGFRTAAGDYVEESLPNITGEVHAGISQRALGWSGSGAFKGYKVTGNNANPASLSNTADHNNGFEFDASLSSSTYKDNAPVQERAVQSYLYFYVGRFTPTSIEQSAGLNTEALDDKADKDLGNLSTSGQSRFQAPLVSGTNIKTINGNSVLGSGDVSISAGANIDLSNLSAMGNDKFVTKDTEQTITKHKTFTSAPSIKNTNLPSNSTIPASGENNVWLYANANDDSYIGGIGFSVTTTASRTLLFARKNINGTDYTCYSGNIIGNDGSTYFIVPTPSSAVDNSTKAATTAWVRNHCCTTAATTTSSASKDAPAYVVENYRSGENWYRVWSDGWIEQGGVQTNNTSGSTSYTVSLLKAFVTTDYTAMRAPVWGASWGQASSDGYTTGIFSKTTTYFTCATHASGIASKIMWYACGY